MKRTGFTSGERMIATEHDCHVARWSGRTPGNFWCHTCGHKFAVGDGYRWIYSNGHSPSAGNFMVCDSCDIGNEKMIEIRQEAIKLLSIVPDEYDAAMIVAYQLCLKNNAIARHKQFVLANYDEPDCSIIENLELWKQIERDPPCSREETIIHNQELIQDLGIPCGDDPENIGELIDDWIWNRGEYQDRFDQILGPVES